MRLELEKKQKKSDKQNTLNTYDGRLRLRESDDDSSVVDGPSLNSHQSSSLGRLITYNPSNNILYPTATNQSSVDLGGNSNPYGSNDETSRNCVTTLAESPLDLHYAFRNDYVDIAPSDSLQTNYPSLYGSPNYYAANSGAAFDFAAMNANSPSTIIPNFSPYTTNIPYNGLLSNANVTVSCSNDGSSTSSTSYYNSVNSDCVNLNGSLFDSNLNGSHDDSMLSSNPMLNNKTIIIKYSEFSEGVASAADLNCLLNGNDNVVPSSTANLSGPTPTPTSSTIVPNATDQQSFEPKYQSDFVNKLHMIHNYGLSTEPQTKTNENELLEAHSSNNAAIRIDKPSDLFEKDSVLTN